MAKGYLGPLYIRDVNTITAMVKDPMYTSNVNTITKYIRQRRIVKDTPPPPPPYLQQIATVGFHCFSGRSIILIFKPFLSENS